MPRNDTIFVIVPTASTLRHALRQQGWTDSPDRGNGHVRMHKQFASNADIVAQLDRFDGQKVTAWVGATP